MMQRLLTGAAAAVALNAAGVAAEETASKPGLPLLTISGTYDFVSKSVFLASDLTQFTAMSALSTGMDFLPPDVYRQVVDQYEDVLSQIDTVRIQNGVPTFAALKKDGMREYEKTVQPIVDGVMKQVKKHSEVPTKILKNVVAKFEKEYPASKGTLSADLFDFGLTILFLVYYVMDYIIGMFCYLFCCGMCAKRKKATPSVVPSKAVVPKTSDPKKKAR